MFKFIWVVSINMLTNLGSKQHSLQVVELSHPIQTAVQIVSKPPAPNKRGPIYWFFLKAGHADELDGWRCSS